MSKENLNLPTIAASSTPRLHEFNPALIPFQYRFLYDLRNRFNFDQGTFEFLLSGAVGSAKSLLGAHLMATHALKNPGSQQIVVRRALKDLKATFWRVLLAHYPRFREWYNKSDMAIYLPNGSIIFGGSYDDGNYDRFRSYELSGALIEEATECKEEELYDALLMRVGRLPHVGENYMGLITNPDSPAHWIHGKFMDNPTPTRHVYYSITDKNPFLKPTYVSQLRASLPAKMALRMLDGQWIEINDDVIYYEYDAKFNYRDEIYVINPQFPIYLTFDFNVALNKPMSAALGQFINDEWHWFSDVVVKGARTITLMEEIQSRGFFDWDVQWIIDGDATGRAGTSASLFSNYDIITNFLSNYMKRDLAGQIKTNHRVSYKKMVPIENPPIRTRHNMMNLYCHNADGRRRFFVYKGAQVLHKGMRLTALKKGAQYLEDDSKEYQHVTTAVGYAVTREAMRPKSSASSGRQ